MSKQAKRDRGALREIVLDILPEILTKAFADEAYKKITDDVTLRLKVIEKNVKETLEAVDQRSKDSLGYLVRQSSSPASVQPDNTVPAERGTEDPALIMSQETLENYKKLVEESKSKTEAESA